ncbi:hypothetical protein N9289_03120 [Candidatus Poseidonia sp.]|nr:hypothetical protein [Poseidonia sp.]
MAKATRGILMLTLCGVVVLVLLTLFQDSEFTLALVIATLFITALGIFLLGLNSSRLHEPQHLGTTKVQSASGREGSGLAISSPDLPDPLDYELDIPL